MTSRIDEPVNARRNVVRAVSVASLALLLTGCVGQSTGQGGQDDDDQGSGGGTDNSSGASDEIAASSTTTSLSYGSDFQIDVYPIKRLSDDVALLNFTVTNAGEDTLNLFHNLSGMQGATTAEGVTLIDSANGKRHMPLKTTDDQCHCSDFGDGQKMSSGESTDIWVAYPAPPADVERMTMTTLASPDILNIPVIDASGEEAEIAEATTADPEIRDITSLQMGEEETREESADESKVMLSSDVLFDVDESKLTSDADTALEDVAAEIDESSAEEVTIDGYTDNSGNDSINNPLSKDRAEAVQKRLEDLVAKDVTYTSEGHGSSDPIATNDNEDGREQNRRVTISFAK